MALNALVFAPFNQILGTASTNVPAYSNTDDERFSIERHYMHGIYMGIKWQCVEYARRWLLLRKSCTFKNVRHAADIWTEITYVERVSDGEHFPLKAHPNGSPTLPKIDSFLIYSRCTEQPVGHIAVICEVGPNYIGIAEQNNKFHYWDGEYARQIPMIYKDGLYYIEDEDPIYGWMEIEDDHQLKPLDESGIQTIHSQYQQPPPTGKMERCTIPQKHVGTKDSWLNKDDPAEAFFMEHYSKDFERVNNCSGLLSYYKINFDFVLNIATVSNELHGMFLEATNRVIHTDELLTRFGIPEVFWNRIRQSWINDQNLTMTGRFDIAFDGKQLKVLEYNADSASALFECAIMQRKWAEAVELPSVFTSGVRLHRVLVNNWKNMKITTRVHLLIDNNNDEMLVALYMQNAMKEVDIESKLCVGIDQLYWKDGTIIDSDGETVKLVWKSWTWDTIFQDYIDATKERGFNNDHSTKNLDNLNGQHPRISDIFLHEQIKVIEPLWKVITSNKALLPVLWHMYPNHPNLLHSESNLTNELKQISFVKKPIVGRCGQNITLYGPGGDSVVAETTGDFSTRDSIYQELFPLKNDHGYHAILGSWIIRGHFGGFVVREDQNLIINNNSSIKPCCIVWEEEK
jgi:glutathionylspermidine synthase